MEEPHSKPMLPLDSPVVSFPECWSRARIRIVLLVLHIAVLAAAIALMLAGYFFELGYYVGSVLLFGSLLLWFLLYSVRSRRGILAFCALAVAQAGFIAFIAMRFRGENRAIELIIAEAMQRRKEGGKQKGPVSMDPPFGKASSKPQLSSHELH